MERKDLSLVKILAPGKMRKLYGIFNGHQRRAEAWWQQQIMAEFIHRQILG